MPTNSDPSTLQTFNALIATNEPHQIIHFTDEKRNNIFHLAAQLGKTQEVIDLVKDGRAFINTGCALFALSAASNKDGNCPIHIAVINGQEDDVKKLLEISSPINLHNKERLTPLDLALNLSNNVKMDTITDTLILYGANPKKLSVDIDSLSEESQKKLAKIKESQIIQTVHYTWIGPIAGSEKSKLPVGRDVEGALQLSDTAQKEIHINFWCILSEKEKYQKIFHPTNVNVKCIEEHLHHLEQQSLQEDTKERLDKIKFIIAQANEEKFQNIQKNVMAKDGFTLFLLSTEGGYTVDASVTPSDQKTTLCFTQRPHFYLAGEPGANVTNFVTAPCSPRAKRQMIAKQKATRVRDVWLMYCPSNSQIYAKQSFDAYFSGFQSLEINKMSKEEANLQAGACIMSAVTDNKSAEQSSLLLIERLPNTPDGFPQWNVDEIGIKKVLHRSHVPKPLAQCATTDSAAAPAQALEDILDTKATKGNTEENPTRGKGKPKVDN